MVKLVNINKTRTTAELQLPDDIIKMASGFPIGTGGSGCTCGAVIGGIMSIGLFFGRTNPKEGYLVTLKNHHIEIHQS